MSNDKQNKLSASGEAAEKKSSSKSPDSPQQPCAGEAAWIEIELFDEHDKAIADEKYVLVLPDGTERKGKTDVKGLVRVENIEPGKCVVKFPDVDQGDWELPAYEGPPPIAKAPAVPVVEVDETATAWIEVELLDQNGNPVPGECYWIQLHTGEIRQGELDHNGWARVEGISPGTCVVKFPDIDEEDWELPAHEGPPPLA
jgi:hypothetical protein